MSRNLCSTSCQRCHSSESDSIVLDEPARPITKAEAGPYLAEYEGLLVARATCSVCGARYLAHVDETGRKPYTWPSGNLAGVTHVWRRSPRDGDGRLFFDLSFRSTFDDEPGPDDLPPWETPAQMRAALAALRAASRAAVEEADRNNGDDRAMNALAALLGGTK
jgi:hypothetical protein